MSQMYYWRKDPVFDILCDTIFNDNLVCFTGAGISRGIRRKSDPEKNLPSWSELLDELRRSFPSSNSGDQRDVELLLGEKSTPGDWLIQAATILRSAAPDEAKFDEYVRDCVEASDLPNQGSSDSHRAIAALEPRGIITFNYDEGHELQWDEVRKREWQVLLPKQEERMLACISQDFKERFLLKAHGSIRDDEPLVLDLESYRQLLTKNPTYRAFVGCVLTRFSLVIVGFGMSDPDFDDFLRMISNEMGGPVRQHVLITKGESEKRLPEHVVLERRYGIHALLIADWGDIPELLHDAISRPCDRAKKTMSDCVSEDVIKRRLAHQQLSRLSIPGRRIMLSDMHKKLSAAIDESNLHAASEIIYSLGKLGFDEDTKQLLFTLLAPRNHREISAHAALALDHMVRTPADTERLESCLREHLKRPPPRDPQYPDPDNRIPIYLAYLIAKNRRRTAEDDADLRNTPMPFVVTITPGAKAQQ